MKRKIFLKKKKIENYGKFLIRDFKFLQAVNDNILLNILMFYKNFLIKNFLYYHFFLKNLRKNTINFFLYTYFRSVKQIHILTPFFLFDKQFFSKNIFFFNLMCANNVYGFFLFKAFFKNFNFFNDLNFFYSCSFLLFNTNEATIKQLELLNDTESKKFFFFLKNKYDLSFTCTHLLFNFFFSTHLSINVEIYKIINFLQILK